MPHDANKLWWPPVSRLHHILITERLRKHDDAQLKGALTEYEPLLLKGLGWFKHRNSASQRLLGTETVLTVGSKKLPVDASLRANSLEVSRLLNLDELQSYVLLRRWLSREGLATRELGPLSALQLSSIAGYYAEERGLLLSCLGDLLQRGRGPTQDPFHALTDRLLQNGLEEAVCISIETAFGGAASSPEDMQGVELTLADISMTQDADPMSDTYAPEELQALLEVAILLYVRQDCSCSLERGKRLLGAVHGLIVYGPGDLRHKPPAFRNPEYLALVLLLAVLDIGKLVAVVREGKRLDGDAHRLGTEAAREEIDRALLAWGPPTAHHEGRPSVHAAVLLAWATFLCLSNSASTASASSGSGPDWQGHANLAWSGQALSGLHSALQSRALAPGTEIGEVFRRPVLDFANAFLGCFRFTPSGLPQGPLASLTGFLSGIFSGHDGLCTEFWANPEALVPLHRFLDDARDLVPALTTPFLKLLSALASGSSGASAADYLQAFPVITCRYSSDSPSLERLDEHRVRARDHVRFRGVVLGQGLEGRIVPQPACSGQKGGVGSEIFVAWGVGGLTRLGLLILLQCIRGGLAGLNKALLGAQMRGATYVESSSAEELELGLQLLAGITQIDPLQAMEVIELEAVGEADAPLPDLLAAAADALCRTQMLSLPAIGYCFQIAASLSADIPARVAQAFSGTTLLQAPAAGWESLEDSSGLLECRPHNLVQLNTRVEGLAGEYGVTFEVLRLATQLLRSGVDQPLLPVLISYAVTHVLAKHRQWRYSQRSDRWELAAAALSVLQAALETEDAALSTDSPSLASGLRDALSQPGAGEAYLAGALPPHARRVADCVGSSAAELPALESVVLQWARLIPSLLRPGMPGLQSLATTFFKVSGSSDASPATILASYVAYPAFGPSEQGELIAAVAALGEAASTLPHVSFAASVLQSPGGAPGVDQDVRTQMLLPLLQPSGWPLAAFRASCRLVQVASAHHPSMQDALLYPTSLSPPEAEQRAEDQTQAGAPLALPSASQPQASPTKARPRESALDGLWRVLQSASSHEAREPEVLAHTLQTLLAIWQGGSTTVGATELLRNQPGFWKAVLAILPESQRRTLDLLGEEEPPVSFWLDQADVAWRHIAEATALELFALDCYRHPRPNAGDSADSGAWLVLDAESERLLGLLGRYSSPCARDRTVRELAREAKAAASLLVASVSGESPLEVYLRCPVSLLGNLYEAANAPASARSGARKLPQDLGRILLQACSTTSRGAAQYGARYLYDDKLLLQKVSPALVQEVPLVAGLAKTIRAVSVLASVADARLTALKGLRAVFAVARFSSPSEGLMRPVELLDQTLRQVVGSAGVAKDLPHILFSPADSGLAVASEIARIALGLLQSKGTNELVAPRTAALLSLTTLELARAWIEKIVLPANGLASRALQDEVTASVLAASLTSLREYSPALAADSRPEAGEKLEAVLLGLLPPLCRISLEGSRTATTSLTLLTSALTSFLPPDRWLPVIETSLDLNRLLDKAFSQVADTAPQGDSGTQQEAHSREDAEIFASSSLQLALVVCGSVNGSSCLVTRRFHDILQAVGQWLLSSSGGGLLESPAGRGGTAQPLWTGLVALQGLLTRRLLGRQTEGRAAVVFGVTSHERLLAGLEPPGEGRQLTLASVQEAERTMFFYCGLATHMGRWLDALLSGPRQVRQAATDWLDFVAGPFLDLDFRITCPPVSTSDKMLAKRTPSIASSEYWFGVCAEGARVQAVPRPGEAAAARLPRATQYSSQLATGIYGTAAHALAFLLSCAPEINEEEAKQLGPDWPIPDVLVSIQQQAVAIVADVGVPPLLESGVNVLGTSLLSLLLLSRNLQDVLRFSQGHSHEQEVAETVSLLRKGQGARLLLPT